MKLKRHPGQDYCLIVCTSGTSLRPTLVAISFFFFQGFPFFFLTILILRWNFRHSLKFMAFTRIRLIPYVWTVPCVFREVEGSTWSMRIGGENIQSSHFLSERLSHSKQSRMSCKHLTCVVISTMCFQDFSLNEAFDSETWPKRWSQALQSSLLSKISVGHEHIPCGTG